MERLTENKIVIIKRNTRLEELITRFNTIGQAKFYIEHLGADFSDYLQEHKQYKNALSEAHEVLSFLGRVEVVDRTFLPNYLFGENDLVIAIGQDGLVANTLKYLQGHLLIGINPDPERWDGVLLPFSVRNLAKVVPEVFKEQRTIKKITMAKVVLNDGQTLYAVNDLFIGQRTHVSAVYEIESGKKRERQSSSGIIVSTGLGSTGWLKSIVTGASSLTNFYIGRKAIQRTEIKYNWDAKYLYYSVREPFPSKTTSADLVAGKVTEKEPLKILSLMPENGVIFSDGLETDYLQFNSGISATITLAEKVGLLVV